MSEFGANKGETTTGDDPATGSHFSSIPGRPIEMILLRQLAGYLDLAVILADPSWSVIYYNEPAERILGRSFDEAGPVPWTDWSTAFDFTDSAGQAIPAEDIPVLAALRSRQISQLEFWLRGLDGTRRHVYSVGIPLVGNAGRFHGSVAVFQEIES